MFKFETGHPGFHPEFHPEFDFRGTTHIPPTRGNMGGSGGVEIKFSLKPRSPLYLKKRAI
jgi:hypothetical protein